MKPSSLALVFLTYTVSTSADLCLPTSLLGLGAAETLSDTFALVARDLNGTMLPVTSSDEAISTGFYFPLSLAPADTTLDSSNVPIFQLQDGVAYANGGEVLSTQATPPLLFPQQLFVSSDSTQIKELFVAVNSTCDGVAYTLLRFSSITFLPIASAAINGSFAPGTTLASPILLDLLTLGDPIDFIIVPANATSD